MRSLILPAVAIGAPAAAQPPIVAAAAVDPSGVLAVDLLATNPDAAARSLAVAPHVEADLATAEGTRMPVRLDRAADQPATVMLPAGGFVRLRYRGAVPAGVAPGLLALTLPGAPAIALTFAAPPPAMAAAEPVRGAEADRPAAEERGRSGFLANLSSYEPIYAVYGPGTDTAARLQLSLQYQFFGTPGQSGSWLDGIRFGYTQQMLWDLERASSPFRDVSYMPELFYALPRLATAGRWAIGGRFGLRHQSNGRSGAASRSFTILYAEPEATGRIGGYDVAIGPRAWIYVGRRSDNPDIARYRGTLGAFGRIGRANGVQLDLSGRIDPRSGRGAAEGLISYPLTGIVAAGPKLYLFGQGFAGFGESLLDYDRRQTRLRAGIGITR